MDVQFYIGSEKLDLFKDEKVEINLNVKNIADISKILSDFTQSVTVPASPNNNRIFSYWYDATVDGTFNANIKADALIELNSLTFKIGSIQLDNAKLKNGLPYSYSLTFFSNQTNLSDKFGDDLLSVLDLSALDHSYNVSTVTSAMHSNSISDDLYYPLITATNEISIGTTGARDLIDAGNSISYREFKPAVRFIRIIQAIEVKYGVTFSRDFFDRSIFYNLFMWMSKAADVMKAFGNTDYIDITSKGTIESSGAGVVDLAADTVTVTTPIGFMSRTYFQIKIAPATLFNDVPYRVTIERNGTDVSTRESTGLAAFNFQVQGLAAIQTDVYKAKISAATTFNFTSQIEVAKDEFGSGGFYLPRVLGTATTPLQTVLAFIKVSDQFPEMTVKAFFNSLISQFHLVITPITKTGFYVDTEKNWYSKGKTYDITRLVDIKDITVKRPDVKKKIDFLYQKAGAILGAKYLDMSNGYGYGDLKATFATAGTDMKVESQFENLMFERMPNEATNDLTDIQAGYSIGKDLAPYKGKPFMFYRNGIVTSADPIKIQPAASFSNLYHTATEDNLQFNQVTQSLNFGADNSTYFYAPIIQSLYFNHWKTYIEDLYNTKTRLLQLKCVLPVTILYPLKLNDRVIIQDKKYKISTLKVDLTNGEADIEVYSDFSSPSDSVNNIIPLTVDRTDVTVDSDVVTVDAVSTHVPVTSYITNGISTNSYLSSKGEEYFELEISANTNWSIANPNSAINLNKNIGNKSDIVRVGVLANPTGSLRSFNLTITIGTTPFGLNIIQT